MTAFSDVTRALLTLSMLKGVGSKTLMALLRAAPERLDDETYWPELAPAVRKALQQPGERDRVGREVVRQEEALVADGGYVVSPLDDLYPPRLAAIPDAPPLLFFKGNLRPVHADALAVIGTREPTRSGVRAAQQITAYVANQGFSIVSGLAKGIDRVGHEVALEQGRHTVAVLAHGLDHLYPAAHRPLAERILEQGGALVTEYPYGVKPFGPQFVQRDRIQAGLAQAVLLVQTDMAGGSLHASRAALHYGRLLIVPVPAKDDVERDEPKAQGVHYLISGSQDEVATFLKTTAEVVRQNVFVLHSKADYEKLLARLGRAGKSALSSPRQPIQEGLFDS